MASARRKLRAFGTSWVEDGGAVDEGRGIDGAEASFRKALRLLQLEEKRLLARWDVYCVEIMVVTAKPRSLVGGLV